MLALLYSSAFTVAYAVDNNCMINIVHIIQLKIALGCIEDRLDALENAPIIEQISAEQIQADINESITKTNIGTTYIGFYTLAFNDELLAYIYCGDSLQYRVVVLYDYVGTGTHSIRVVSSSNSSNVLQERTNITADLNPAQGLGDWVNKPSWCTPDNNYHKIIIEGKSTVGTDDPVIHGYTIWSR